MKRFLQILIISFATLVLVANNVILQYIEKSSIASYSDQDDDDGKSEKNEPEQKVKDFLNVITTICFQYEVIASIYTFHCFDVNKLPFIFIDVELLPPNMA